MEKGKVSPDPASAHRLSALAHREPFLDAKLAGSAFLAGELAHDHQLMNHPIDSSVDRSVKQLYGSF